jgi:hypothetical protein
MAASAGITTRGAKLDTSNVRLRLKGSLWRHRSPENVIVDATEFKPPGDWSDVEVCYFSLSEEPREGSDLVLAPISMESAQSWSGFLPSFISRDLAMTYLLEVTNGIIGELMKVPVVRQSILPFYFFFLSHHHIFILFVFTLNFDHFYFFTFTFSG